MGLGGKEIGKIIWSVRSFTGNPIADDGYSTSTLNSAYVIPISPNGSVFAQAGGGFAFGAKRLAAIPPGGPLLFGAYGRNDACIGCLVRNSAKCRTRLARHAQESDGCKCGRGAWRRKWGRVF